MDYGIIRFSKRDGVNHDHIHTLRHFDSLVDALKEMGESGLLYLWSTKRNNRFDIPPVYFRLWRGEDIPANALVYLDIIPFERPEFRFRVDRHLLGKNYGREGNHIVMFSGFDAKSRYQKLIDGIRKRDYWHDRVVHC